MAELNIEDVTVAVWMACGGDSGGFEMCHENIVEKMKAKEELRDEMIKELGGE